MKSLKKVLTLVLTTTLLLQLGSIIVHKVVSEASPQDFRIVYVNVRSSADTAEIYPGSRRVSLKIEAVYQDTTTAREIVGWLNLTDGMSFTSGSGACSPARLLNGSVAQEVGLNTHVTFEYLLDIASSAEPKDYNLGLNITYVKENSIAFETYQIKVTVSPYPQVSLKVVDAYFSPASYPGSVDTNLYVILENNGSTINSANFNLTLPEGFVVKNPRASTGLVNRGERFTLTFTGITINVEKGNYSATIHADCNARTDDGVLYSNTTTLEAQVKVESPPPEEPIMVAAVNTLYNGEAAPLLPSARGVILRIYFINRLPDAMSAMNISARVPNGMDVRAISGTYINGMPAGGTCYVDLNLDVDSNVVEGLYGGTLDITYLKMVSGASFLMNQTIRFPISIETIHSYVPELILVSAYWGYPDPTPVYSTSRYVPLTIRLVNYGRYSVWGVVVNASSQHLTPVKDSEACATTVARGGACTAVLYFDINTTALNVPVKIFANYIFTEFGTHVSIVRNFTVSLPIESYPASESILSLVDAGWQNHVNVFPRTSNATYQVTLANRAPYSIAGVNLKLKLPAGITSKGLGEATAYLEGPVRSLATLTASFMISVGDIQPGSYNATLTADCILLSGGPGVRRVENFNVQICVNDDGSALEVLDARWYEGSVGPDTYGAHLIVLVRNVYVDGLHGAVLVLELPEGIYNAVDNSSIVRAAPLSMQLQLPPQQQNLAEILSAFLSAQQASPAQVYSRGDVLTFMFSLNLLDVEVGKYILEGHLSYIDGWGGSRQIPTKVPVAILGKVGYIEIVTDKTVSVRSRYTNASLTLVNHGSSPVYDAYVAISPYQGTPILIASPALNYIEKILPGESCEIPLTLAYNPLGFYTQTGGTMAVTYGPVPFMVSIIYRDACGYQRVFNNSVVVVVEPFIELVLRNVKATSTGAASKITGTITNYGSSAAKRVEVEVKIGSAAGTWFIDAIDPGSDAVFTVDVGAYAESAILTIKYYDAFDELASKTMNITVTLQEAPQQPVQGEGFPIERWIIVAGVIVFLIVATVIIYRTVKKTKLVEGSP
ncbi:MAG: hypothetical protein QXH20_03905 [Candidatus Bathyarchaeia archaeon]